MDRKVVRLGALVALGSLGIAGPVGIMACGGSSAPVGGSGTDSGSDDGAGTIEGGTDAYSDAGTDASSDVDGGTDGSNFDGGPPDLPGEFGPLTNFYRATQLQGSLSINGLELTAPMPYLLGSDVDIVYKPRPGTSSEVLFVDTFLITRFLGGETPTQVQAVPQDLIPYDSTAPCRSLDYARSDGSGGWTFYGIGRQAPDDLVSARLDPYLDAGYAPADITLVLSNVPWDAARTGTSTMCAAPPSGVTTGSLGVWGQCNPPASFTAWSTIVGQLATDLVTRFGAAAAKFSFEVGDEYDGQQSYNATSSPTSQDFYSLYENAYAAVHAAIATAPVLAGDFTGAGDGASLNYSTPDFLTREAQLGTSPAYVPRSLNGQWNNPGKGATPLYQPSETVKLALSSYTDLPAGTIAEVHQFGFLYMPDPIGNASTDESAISANWYLQALLGLKEQLSPQRVAHWDTTVNIPQGGGQPALKVLNGIGYSDLLLDHYLGAEMYDLAVVPVLPDAGSTTSDVKAFAFWKDGKTALALSHFDVSATAAPEAIAVTVPSALIAPSTTSFRYLRSSATTEDDVFVAVKADLMTAGLLSTNFQNCALCFGTPADMVLNGDVASALPTWSSNAAKYMAIAKRGITWRSTSDGTLDGNGVAHALTFSGQTLKVTLGANELLILEPQ